MPTLRRTARSFLPPILVIFSPSRHILPSETSISLFTVRSSVLLPLPLCREGDTINIDIPNASITLEVSDEVLAQRKAKYVAPEPNIKTGWLSRYARMVTSANLGAVLK